MQREEPKQHRGLPEWDRAHRVIGAFYETYNVLGFGFLESVYSAALARELRTRGMRVQQECPIQVIYKGERVGTFRIDLLVEDRIIVELKASAVLGPTDKRQLLNYLRATTIDVGLLLHYGPDPKFHRLVSPRILAGTDGPVRQPSEHSEDPV